MDRDYVIRVILTGTNLLSGKLKEAARDADGMFKKIQQDADKALRGVERRRIDPNTHMLTRDLERQGGLVNALRGKYALLRSEVEKLGKLNIANTLLGLPTRQQDALGRYTTDIKRQGGLFREFASMARSEIGEVNIEVDRLMQRISLLKFPGSNAILGTPTRQRNASGQFTRDIRREGGLIQNLPEMVQSQMDSARRRLTLLSFPGSNTLLGTPTRQRNELGQFTQEIRREEGLLQAVEAAGRRAFAQISAGSIRAGEAMRSMNVPLDAFRSKIGALRNIDVGKMIMGSFERQRNELGQFTKEVQRHGGVVGGLAGVWRGLTRDVDVELNKQGKVVSSAFSGMKRELTGAEMAGFRLRNVFTGSRRAITDLEHGVKDLTKTERLAMGPGFNFGYNLGRGLDKAVTSLTRFNPAFGMLLGLGMLVITMITNLVGALTALASAAVMAAAGIGGALVAALAQLAPVVGVLFLAFERLKNVFAAASLHQKQFGNTQAEAITKAREHRDSVERLADAHYALGQSYQAVTTATQNLADAQKNLRNQEQEAKRNLVDVEFTRQEAVLGEKDATLSLLEAKQALADFDAKQKASQSDIAGEQAALEEAKRRLAVAQAQGSLPEVEQAQQAIGVHEQNIQNMQDQAPGADAATQRQRLVLSIQQAVLNQREAEVRLARAIEDANKAEREGVRNAPGVLAAKEQLRSAEQSLADAKHSQLIATRNLKDTTQDLADAQKQAALQSNALERAMGKLDPAEKRLLDTLLRVKKEWQTATRPLTDIIVNAVDTGLKRSEALLRDPRLAGAFKRLTGTIGAQFNSLTSFFTGRQQRGFMTFFTGEAAKNLPQFTKIFEHLVVLFEKIAKAASPELTRLLGHLEHFLGAKSEGTNVDKLTKFFNSTDKYIMGLVHLLGSFLGLLGAIIKGAAGPGLTSMEGMSKQFDKWATWINKHPQKVHKFFEDMISSTGKWIKLFANIIVGLNHLAQSKGFQNLIDWIEKNAVPILDRVAGMFTTILGIVSAIGKIPGVGWALQWVAGFVLLSKTIPGVGSMFKLIYRSIIGSDGLVAAFRLLAYSIGDAGLIGGLKAFISTMGKPGRFAVWGVIGFVIDKLLSWVENLKIVRRWIKWFADEVGVSFTSMKKIIDSILKAIVILLLAVFFGPEAAIIVGIVLFRKRFLEAFEYIADHIGDIWHAIVRTVELAVNKIIGFANTILEHVGLGKNVIPTIPIGGKEADRTPVGARAQGGLIEYRSGGLVKVAEEDDEMVIPLAKHRRSRAWDLVNQTMGILGGAEAGAQRGSGGGVRGYAGGGIIKGAIHGIVGAAETVGGGITGAGKFIGGEVLKGVSAVFRKALNEIANVSIPKGPFGLVRGIVDFLKDKLIHKLVSEITGHVGGIFGRSGTGGLRPPPGNVSTSGNSEVGRRMAAARGWTGKAFDALYGLWNRESGWSQYADTRVSGAGGDNANSAVFAYGIPQARPWSKYPKAGWPEDKGGHSDVNTQIGWGLNYIHGRYGDPLTAWGHENQYGWYQGGGPVSGKGVGAPVRIMAHVGEWVLNHSQQLKLARAAFGGNLRRLRAWLFGDGGIPGGIKQAAAAAGMAVKTSKAPQKLPKHRPPKGKRTHDPDSGLVFVSDTDSWGIQVNFVEGASGEWYQVGTGELKGRQLHPKGIPGVSSSVDTLYRRSAARQAYDALALGGDWVAANALRNHYGFNPIDLRDPGTMMAPSATASGFAAGGVITGPSYESHSPGGKTVNQKFEINTKEVSPDVDFIMRQAQLHAELSF